MTQQDTYGPFEVDQQIVAKCRYYVGQIGGRFYELLGKERKITGVRCETCDKVYWPPRSTCGRCFSMLGEKDLVVIGPEGTLETFTRIAYEEPVHPKKGPLIYGVIRLDGAGSGMAHLIGGVDYDALKIGMRMRPVFNRDPKGTMLDIDHFEPVG
ncbi:MAG: Zn-ribbon domain-containing OB-fold protein [Desulfatitalea sp.]|nr:Zn-ribbon domain-containing OB-fold protein [Desulfatitalea sp.]NNK02541.1 Zn-ribbon domain-containing OB-fold protein [Desulfatitalea sp.]